MSPAPSTSPQPPGDDASLEARFAAFAAGGAREEAATLLMEHLGEPLARKLKGLALPLGGGDEAEHLASWAISVAVTKADAFDPRRGSLATWVFWLGRNLALSQRRKLRPEPGLRGELCSDARTVESRIQNSDAFRAIWERLPSEIHRRVLFLDLQHHGQAPGGLARELGLDRATFYKRRSEARRAFRQLWTETQGDPGQSFYGELE